MATLSYRPLSLKDSPERGCRASSAREAGRGNAGIAGPGRHSFRMTAAMVGVMGVEGQEERRVGMRTIAGSSRGGGVDCVVL